MRFHYFSALFLASALPAQTLSPVGFRDVPIANVTSSGNRVLQSRIQYPATRAGRDAPLRARQGGWPVFVFLHGFTGLGRFYPDLGAWFASRGIIAVMSDTSQFSNAGQFRDGVALFPSLVALNDSDTFFKGALDMKRCGLGGHSMGGGNTVAVLASNPGYLAGVCFAPVGRSEASRVQRPLAIIHGTGDTVLPWRTHALRNYDGATAFKGLKALYLMNNECSHSNLTFRSSNIPVFERTMRIAYGFLTHYLEGNTIGLEQVVGRAARAETRLTSLRVAVEQPEHWQIGTGKIGTTQGLRIAAEPGVAALFFAEKRASNPTPWGTLLLDPASLAFLGAGAVDATRLYNFDLAIPNDPELVNSVIPFQGISVRSAGGQRLTGAVDLTVK